MLRYEIDQNYESRLRIVRAIWSRFIIGETEEKNLPTLYRPSNEGGAGDCDWGASDVRGGEDTAAEHCATT